MVKKIVAVLAFLCALAEGVAAQETTGGRQVRRITFDREQVNIEYADGTTDNGVAQATVKRENTATGVKTAKTVAGRQMRQWYTIDGRSLQGEPRRKGVYVVRDEKGVKKTIKK